MPLYKGLLTLVSAMVRSHRKLIFHWFSHVK